MTPRSLHYTVFTKVVVRLVCYLDVMSYTKLKNFPPSNTSVACLSSSCFFLEKRKMSNRDQPLWERILQGPSDDTMKIFLMDMNEEEVSNDVSASRYRNAPRQYTILQNYQISVDKHR